VSFVIFLFFTSQDGIIALFFEPIIAVVSFFVFWIALRLLSEVILSIFEMRISLKNKN
jgi:hypothetical protein